MNTTISIPLSEFGMNPELGCPYHERSGICSASLSCLMVSRYESAFCDSEDYDNCPLFLSKVLRR
ncbi:MAG: hypothetical protein ACK415_00810 [Thermodesulfovibrionales bacterium]